MGEVLCIKEQILISDNLYKINWKEQQISKVKTDRDTLVNGNRTKSMDLEFILGQMAKNIKEIISIISVKVRALCFMKMVSNIQGNGKMAIKTE